jgi:hypothetical protein
MTTATLQGVLVSALLAVPALADSARIEQYKAELRGIRPPELPGETARLISSANADAADAVTAALSLSGASPQLIVGAVAKASPKSAAAAAAAAIAAQSKLSTDPSMQPRLTLAITKAAVIAAPTEFSAIVAESCKARPVAFYTIGVSAAEAAPRSSEKVIPAIGSGVPTLKPLLERAERDFKTANRSASVALILKHAENLLASISREQNISPDALLAKETEASISVKVATLAAGPTPFQGPPFVNSPAGAAEVPLTVTTNIAPTNRVYSLP